jgi:hypothetical protein
MVGIEELSAFSERNVLTPFQKNMTVIGYDRLKDRLVAGGLDNQLKFFSCEGEDDKLSVTYKIKVPAEIFSFDFSVDGNHFAMGLTDGSLIVKSKKIEEDAKEDMDEETKLFQ